jgi:hypothetical protein
MAPVAEIPEVRGHSSTLFARFDKRLDADAGARVRGLVVAPDHAKHPVLAAFGLHAEQGADPDPVGVLFLDSAPKPPRLTFSTTQLSAERSLPRRATSPASTVKQSSKPCRTEMRVFHHMTLKLALRRFGAHCVAR